MNATDDTPTTPGPAPKRPAPTRRRGRDEGSIYQRESDGRWVGSVHIGYEAGKRKRRTVYGRTRAEVADKLRKVQTAVAQGTYIHDDRRTVAEYLAWWLSDVIPGTVKDRTADTYAQMVRLYLTPALGRVRLSKLTPVHVQQMLTVMDRRGLSPATRRQARSVLRRALTHAERFELVHRNAAAQTEPVRGESHRIDDALTQDEARALLAAADGHPLEAVVTVALTLESTEGRDARTPVGERRS